MDNSNNNPKEEQPPAASSRPNKKPKLGLLLECSLCNKEKDADGEFSNTQRNNGANRNCKQCVGPPAKTCKSRLCMVELAREDSDTTTNFSKYCDSCRELLKAPTCSKCQTSKNGNEFAKEEWELVVTSKKAVCLECNEKQKRNEAMSKIWKCKRRGEIFYEYPDGDDQLQFKESLPENIVGTYNVIYQCALLPSDYGEQRTVKGQIIIRESEDGRIHGELERPETRGDSYATANFSFSEVSREEDFLGVRVPVDSLQLPWNIKRNNFVGSFSFINERVAARWIEREHGRYASHGELGLQPPAPFECVEEAEDLVNEWLRRPGRLEKDCSNSWICNHLSLPAPTASQIHGFVAGEAPCPAFFFEEGDLCLEVLVEDEYRGEFKFTLIARSTERPNRSGAVEESLQLARTPTLQALD